MKKPDWILYHSVVKPILMIIITIFTIVFLAWVFWFLNPTTTTPNSEFRLIGEQSNI